MDDDDVMSRFAGCEQNPFEIFIKASVIVCNCLPAKREIRMFSDQNLSKRIRGLLCRPTSGIRVTLTQIDQLEMPTMSFQSDVHTFSHNLGQLNPFQVFPSIAYSNMILAALNRINMFYNEIFDVV